MFDFFKTKPKNYEDIPSGVFHELMLNPSTLLLDVRTSGENQSGKIRNSKNLDIMSRDFKLKINELPKDKTYLVYCRSGNRSAQACEIMAEMGFKNLKNLSGGIMRWPFELV